MKKFNTLILFSLTAVSVVLVAVPCYSFVFPTFDVAEVTNTISGVSAQVDSVNSTVTSTTSMSTLQQSLGDNVGSLSKFTNAQEDLEKKQKKLERQQKRAERLKKLREKARKAKESYNKTKAFYDDAEETYDDAKETYDQATDMYDEGMELYEDTKETYDETQKLPDAVQETRSDVQSFAESSSQSAQSRSSTISGTKTGISKSSVRQAAQSASGSAEQVYEIDEDELNNQEIADLVADSEFAEGAWSGEEVMIETAPEQTVSTISDNTSVGRRPFVKAGSAASRSGTSAAEKTAVPADTGTDVLQAAPAGVETIEETPDTAAMQNGTLGRKAFKKGNLTVSYVFNTPMAFAQEVSDDDFKTGTNDDGKFIFSDIIANKCAMNFDEITEEKVAECIKIFVMGNNDANAVTAAEWKKEFNQALHDHVSADLATAITQKNYSASFDSKVADDLESKAQAMTSEREEVSFAGKVNQVNQEIIIRLMEAMAGQIITDAWASVESIDADYYEEEDE